MRELELKGVRQNNLKNVTVNIPLGCATVVTGPSGSGKSSLAFETVYAEGQRRYMQSLSTYARQFMQQFQQPDVDDIRNIPPTIAIEQINPVRNSRATVATSTELYDYLRLLFEKIGQDYCLKCGVPMERTTLEEIFSEVQKKYTGKTLLFGYSVKLPKTKKDIADVFEGLMASGFSRFVLDGELHRSEEASNLKGLSGKEILVPVDRVRLPEAADEATQTRIAEALAASWEMGVGTAHVYAEKKDKYVSVQTYYQGVRCPKCGASARVKTAASFSFNSPLGACEACKGFGNILEVDEALVIPNARLSIVQGAIDPFTKPSLSHWQKHLLDFCKEARIDVDLPYKDLTQKERDLVFNGNKKFKGVRGVFRLLEKKKYRMRIRVFISRYVSPVQCHSCKGARLNPEALAVRVAGANLAEFAQMTIEGALNFLKKAKLSKRDRAVAADILEQMDRRLSLLNAVGLGYVTLERQTRTLSGGEYQRILLATQLSQGLTDTLYVLDEPSIGLHPKDTKQLLAVLDRLLELGNSLLVVEHDPELIEWGQHILDMGPGSGNRGGEVMFSGDKTTFLAADSRTSKAVRNWREACRQSILANKRQPKDSIDIQGASANNLKGVDVSFPLGCLVSVTGVSGSGKSTLVVDTLYQALAKIFHGTSGQIAKFKAIRGFENISSVELIDQSPIGKTSRSNPITFIKGYDEIRAIFARTREAVARGYGPGHFSFNVKGGRCDRCDGEGRVRIDMVFMEDVHVPCEACDGKRFKPQTLQILYKDHNVDDVLRMTVDDAHRFFSTVPSLRMKLGVLQEVGLGYLQIGQPGHTLSGGEAQRLKIARELAGGGGSLRRSRTLFILDEPTTGLHFEEIEKLLGVFSRLIDSGHSVLTIEHNLQVICASDFVIDLGPDGGDAGGTVLAMGTPKDLAQKKLPHTALYLSEILNE
ncbi:MAG: excinuclease ABC subunit UvrA [Bdellovibrionales bacterium]|nr:excinuclease ABC subunit UvrA [Bdellovibrionales bacterium]